MSNREKYNLYWGNDADDLRIEMHMIKMGGRWRDKSGVEFGRGNSFHYEQMRRLIWPELDGDHNGQRWHALCRDEILKNKITVLMGPGSCGKTHEGAWIYLCEYLVFPKETCVLVSSTDIRGLKKRIWGEVATLWEKAVARFDYLPGNMLDSAVAITTDDIEDCDIGERKSRDMRQGVFGVPCMSGSHYFGLSKFHGIKQKRMRLVADEASMMGENFLSSFANLNKNEDFRAIILGNPNDTMDPLGKSAEPLEGWTNHMEPKKTSVWKTRFMGGTCVNLIGTDSPNFDFPKDQPTRFKYLISDEKIAETLSFFPKDSLEYYSQCIGAMKIGTLSRRVITRDLCRQFGAQDDVIWKGSPTVKIGALDAAYGGDRCVAGFVEFGESMTGKTVIKVNPPVIVPVSVKSDKIAEDQIGEFLKTYWTNNGVAPENCYFDSTGRGSLMASFSRIWSTAVNPVEFGATATSRPVALGLYITDQKTRERRLMLCSEHYDRFVTELWHSVRYAIESEQLKNLPSDIMDEMCLRNWDRTKNNRIRLETKEEMRERVSRSPDLGDFLAIAVEGCRRRGFQISKLGNNLEDSRDMGWFEKLFDRTRALQKRNSLSFR